MEDVVILSPKERLHRLSEHFDVSVRGLAKLSEMSEATLYHITDQTRDMSGRTAATFLIGGGYLMRSSVQEKSVQDILIFFWS